MRIPRGCLLLALLPAVVGHPRLVSSQETESLALAITDVMTPAEFRAAGLHKLSGRELENLDQWFAQYTMLMMRLSSGNPLGPDVGGGLGRAQQGYVVELSHNDELFVINGSRYEARTYCFDIQEGDRVIFTEGSAFGACVSAEFVNLRTSKTCKVWCD